MARQILNSIGIHDDIEDVVRKSNDNFRRLSSQLRQQIDKASTSGASKVEQAVDSALGAIAVALQNAQSDIAAAEAKAEQQLDEKLKEIDDKMAELEDLLEGLGTSEAQSIINTLASLIYGAKANGLRLTIPTGTMIPTGTINIESGDGYIRTHSPTEEDPDDIEWPPVL